MDSVDITPDTKLGPLLDEYPQLEEVLIAQAPEFKKLKNPILQRTVARVATIASAAKIAGLSPRDLVRTLREAVGQDTAAEESTPAAAEPVTPLEPPWVETSTLRETIDVDAVLAAGESPLAGVMRHVRALEPGTMIRVVSSFRPGPLIETRQAQGYHTYLRPVGPDRFETFITRQSPRVGPRQ